MPNGIASPILSERREPVVTFAPDNETLTETQDTNVEEEP